MPKSKSVNKEKRRKINDFATEFVARATGLEPVTYGLTANLIGILKNSATPQESGLFSCWSDV